MRETVGDIIAEELPLRRTGRTTRQLSDAVWRALDGERVVYVTHSLNAADYTRAMLHRGALAVMPTRIERECVRRDSKSVTFASGGELHIVDVAFDLARVPGASVVRDHCVDFVERMNAARAREHRERLDALVGPRRGDETARELAAMTALAALDAPTRARALRWAAERFGGEQ